MMFLFTLLYAVNFLRTLIILVLVYYAIKFLTRYFAPKVIDKAANKLYKDMKAQEKEAGKKRTSKGDVTIEYEDNKSKRYSRGEGDYVDFEEVDK
jgi:hypothetical protein